MAKTLEATSGAGTRQCRDPVFKAGITDDDGQLRESLLPREFRMISKLLAGVLFVMPLTHTTCLFAAEVVVYGLEAMPYCGVINGNPVGIAIDVLTEASNYGAPKFVFRFDLPWLRAQERVQRPGEELAAIIPFSRTPQRENSYRWVAELVPTQYRLYSIDRPTPIKTIDEAKDLRIGVVRGHAIIPMLKRLGMNKLDDGAANAAKNATKLAMKRSAVMADSDLICLYNWKRIGQSTKDLQVGPAIGDVIHVYLATGLQFPDDVARSISDAINKMQRNGRLQKIIQKWKE